MTEAQFLKAVENAPHACFITGDPAQAEGLAKRAAALFCTGVADEARLLGYPDYYELECNKLKIDAVRGLIGELTKRSFYESGRAILLKNAHRLEERTQNTLLKTLEEPPAGTLFLLTGNDAGVLPTLRSRCAVVRTPPADVAAELRRAGADPREAARYAAMGGTLSRALRLYRDEDYRAVRTESAELFFKLLQGELPLNATKSIAAKKTGQDVTGFMLDLARDLLMLRCGGKPLNPDQVPMLEKLVPRFTTGRIQGIIKLLADAQRRLATNAPDGPTLDKLFVDVSRL